MSNILPMYTNSVLLRTEHLTKLYPERAGQRPVGRERRHPSRRIRLHHGAQRQRQIDAAEPARRPGRAHLRRNLLRRPAVFDHPRPQPAAGAEVRLHLPVVLPAARAHGRWRTCRFPCSRAAGSRHRPASRRPSSLLAIVGLEHRVNHLPEQLSVGERQRVAIARALANDPVLLLADEPTGNLDSKSAIGIFELIEKLHRDRGMTVVLITHDDALGQRAERTVRIAGRPAEVGHPADGHAGDAGGRRGQPQHRCRAAAFGHERAGIESRRRPPRRPAEERPAPVRGAVRTGGRGREPVSPL